MKITDFAPGTRFLDKDDIPVASEPGMEPLGWYGGYGKPLSHKTNMNLDIASPISFEEFKALVERSIAAL
jgi:hypothetical protein